MYEYAVRVGYSPGYPVRPDWAFSHVRVWASSDTEATLIAAQIVALRGMPTSTEILEVEL